MNNDFLRLTDENSGVQTLKDGIRDFIASRNWTRNQRPMNLALSVSIEAAELLEIFQWENADDQLTDKDRLQHCEEEMADVLIYLLSLASALKIDLTKATVAKMQKNEKRFTVEETFGKGV